MFYTLGLCLFSFVFDILPPLVISSLFSYITELCNGSITDSGSVGLGSSPSSVTSGNSTGGWRLHQYINKSLRGGWRGSRHTQHKKYVKV